MPITDTSLYYAEPTGSMPAVGGVYWEPTFVYPGKTAGLKVRRLGDVSSYSRYFRHEYASIQAFNCDGTKVMLRDYSGRFIFNWSPTGDLGAPIATLNSTYKIPTWSKTDPNTIYYFIDNSNKLYKRILGDTTYEVHTFSNVVNFGSGTDPLFDANQEDFSNDGSRKGMIGRTAGGTYEAFCYDLTTDSISSSVLTLSSIPDNVRVSPSGNYIVVSTSSGTGAGLGVRCYNSSNMAHIGLCFPYLGHCDITMDSDGVEYLIVDGSNDTYLPSGGHYYIWKSPLPKGYDDGTMIKMVQLRPTCDGRFGTHISCRNTDTHGQANNFAIVSTDTQYDPDVVGIYPFQNEILKVYLDSTEGSPHIARLAHHHSQLIFENSSGVWLYPYDESGPYNYGHTNYWAQAQATISSGGQYIIFASNWHEQMQTTTTPHTDADISTLSTYSAINPFCLHLNEYPTSTGYPTYDHIPDGTWVKLSNISTVTYPSGFTSIPGLAFSGATWDSANDRYMYRGGGHKSPLYNCWFILNPDTFTWTTSDTPCLPIKSDPPTGQYEVHYDLWNVGTFINDAGLLDNQNPYYETLSGHCDLWDVHDYNPPSFSRYPSSPRPWSTHTYQESASDNSGNTLYIDKRKRTWKWSVAGGWQLLVPSPNFSDYDQYRSAKSLVYIPAKSGVHDAMFLLYHGSAAWTYTWASNAWTPVSSSSNPTATIHMTMAYSPEFDRVYLFGGEYYPQSSSYQTLDEFWQWNPVTRQWSRIYTDQIPNDRTRHGTAWDSKNRVLLIWGGEEHDYASTSYYLNDIWYYNPLTNTWKKMVDPPTKPHIYNSWDESNYGVLGQFIYDPSRNVFMSILCVNGSGSGSTWTDPNAGVIYQSTEMWILKYRTDDIFSEGTAPSPPTNLRVVY